ncbi:antigen identified by monoclonal antibody Ki-67 [Haplosporangium bisporale]|nr:antigen identified by monoclonal antibody Ki-67 [Haplosporangium bisporale]KAF9212474.1 antigen identified by monoclonal antibody Ki-67 [Podila verticillata]
MSTPTVTTTPNSEDTTDSTTSAQEPTMASRSSDVWSRIVGLKRSDGSEYAWYPIYKTVCTFGKSLTNDVRVQVETVSDHHCLIIRGGEGELLLKDSSTNGTLLNGELVHGATVDIVHNDILTVGGHKFRFEFTEIATTENIPNTPKKPDQTIQDSVDNAIHSLSEVPSPSATKASTTPRKCFTSGTSSLESSLGLFTPNRASKLSRLLMSPKISAPLFASTTPKKGLLTKELPLADFGLSSLAKVPAGLQTPSQVKRRVMDDDDEDIVRTPKKVSFGPKLSPEIFDRAHPPASPLKRGAQQDPETPRRSGLIMSPKFATMGGHRSAVKSIMTPSKLGRTAIFIDLEKPAPPKLFSAALLAEAEAKGKAAALTTPTTSVEGVKEQKEEQEEKSKASEEAMLALRISPLPKMEIVDAFAD